MSEEVTRAVAVATKSAAVVRAEQNRLQIAEHLAGWNDLKALAAEHIATGYAPAEVTTPAKGALVLMKALELGIPITSAYAYIDIIEGKPALRGQMVNALVERSGKGYMTLIERTALRCVMEGRRAGRPTIRITCAIGDFAHLVNRQNRDGGPMAKNPWKLYPADMLQHKCEARVGKAMFADVLCGMDTAYAGEIIEGSYEVMAEGRMGVIDGPIEDGGTGDTAGSSPDGPRGDVSSRDEGVAVQPTPAVAPSTPDESAIPAEFTDLPPNAIPRDPAADWAWLGAKTTEAALSNRDLARFLPGGTVSAVAFAKALATTGETREAWFERVQAKITAPAVPA